MSVLIKGMEMPKGKALSLIIYPDGDVTVNLKDTPYKAVEIPTPHGDLIDIDEIYYYFEPYKDGSGSLLKITSPTVIESEL